MAYLKRLPHRSAKQTAAGQVKLADFVRTFVDAFNGKGNHRSHTIAD